MKRYKKLPKSVKVGDLVYKVITRNLQEDAELQSAFGYTMLNHPYIVLRDDMSIEQARRYLFHELMHCIYLTSVNHYTEEVYKKRKDVSVGDWEHYFIGTMQGPVLELLRSNPKLAKFLLS